MAEFADRVTTLRPGLATVDESDRRPAIVPDSGTGICRSCDEEAGPGMSVSWSEHPGICASCAKPESPGPGEWYPAQTCAWCHQIGDCTREHDEDASWWTCERCLNADEPPEPDPEPLRLYDPAPGVMRGQTDLGA